jgi:hypothetical protein
VQENFDEGGERPAELSRETLHDLEPTDDQTRLIQGGMAECADGVSNQNALLGITIVVGTTRFTDMPGRYQAITTTTTDFEITEDAKLIVRRIEHLFEEPAAE